MAGSGWKHVPGQGGQRDHHLRVLGRMKPKLCVRRLDLYMDLNHETSQERGYRVR